MQLGGWDTANTCKRLWLLRIEELKLYVPNVRYLTNVCLFHIRWTQLSNRRLQNYGGVPHKVPTTHFLSFLKLSFFITRLHTSLIHFKFYLGSWALCGSCKTCSVGYLGTFNTFQFDRYLIYVFFSILKGLQGCIFYKKLIFPPLPPKPKLISFPPKCIDISNDFLNLKVKIWPTCGCVEF